MFLGRPGLAVLAALMWTAAGEHGLAQRPPPGSPVGARRVTTSPPAIGGTVRDAATGAPLAGAVVSLGRGVPGPAILSNPAGRQVTDHAGRFLFANLEMLTVYHLTASRPGYFDGGYGIGPSGGALQQLRPTSDEWMTDLDIPLVGPGALSGFVTDERGDALVGVRVVSLSREVVAGSVRWMIGPAATTDDRGRYRIAPLLPDEYVVMVPSVRMTVAADAPLLDRTQPALEQLGQRGMASSTHVPRRQALSNDGVHLLVDDGQPPLVLPVASERPHGYVTTFYPAARSLQAASPVTLAAGEERGAMNVQLQSVPLFTVSGAVNPAPGESGPLTLRLVPRGSEDLGLGHETAIARSAADGRFEFLGIPAGDYVVLAGGSVGGYVFPFPGSSALDTARFAHAVPGALEPSYLNNSVLAMRVSMPAAEPYAGQAAATLTSRDVTGVTVPVSRGVALRGRLVQDDAATPSSSSLVEYRRTIVAEPAGGEPMLGLPQAVARAQGASLTFTIENVQPGEYVLRPQDSAVKSIVWNGQDYTERPLPVTAGADLSGIVVTTTTERTVLRGAVWDAEDRPVRASVISFPADPAMWRRYGLSSLRVKVVQTSVNIAGDSLFVQPMPAGEYYIVASSQPPPRLWQDAAYLAKLVPLARRVTVTGSDTPSIDLTVVALPR